MILECIFGTVLGALMGLILVACGFPLLVACVTAAALTVSVIWKADEA